MAIGQNSGEVLNKNINTVQSAECDDDQVTTKKVILYGWDIDNLSKVRVKVSPNGSIATSSNKTAVSIVNITLTLAATLYPMTFPTNCTGADIKLRSTLYDLQLYVTNGGPFITIPKKTVYYFEGCVLPSQTVYLKCDTAGQIVESVQWS